jgi:hypothetical protein
MADVKIRAQSFVVRCDQCQAYVAPDGRSGQRIAPMSRVAAVAAAAKHRLGHKDAHG